MIKENVSDVSESSIAEIVSLGGKVVFAKGQTSSSGVKTGSGKSIGPLSINLESSFN